MQDAIAAMRDAFARLAAGGFEQPPRQSVGEGGVLTMLSSVAGARGDAAAKVVSVRAANPARGLPTIHAAVVWVDGETGRLLAVLDGNTVTALRTGATTGLATDLLAPARAKVLAMLGAGAQAPDQVAAVCAVRPIEEVRIWSRTPASAAALAALVETMPGVAVRTLPSPAAAVATADVVCCATPATAPLFEASALGTRVHVNAIGAYRPDMCELSPELLRDASVVVVDTREAALSEAGDLIQAIERGYLAADRLTELGELASATRTCGEGWTVFKSVGIAVQDLALAGAVIGKAAGAAAPEA